MPERAASSGSAPTPPHGRRHRLGAFLVESLTAYHPIGLYHGHRDLRGSGSATARESVASGRKGQSLLTDQLFIFTAALTIAAEVGEKSQLMSLLLGLRFRRPVLVIAG